MGNEYKTLTKISNASGVTSDDVAYDNEDLLLTQMAKFYELIRGKGHWYEKMERIKQLIVDLSGKKILDLGTQIGTYALYLSKESKLSVGIDFSYRALRSAMKLQNKLNLNGVYFLQANVISFPFKDETFDIVIGCDIVEHLITKDLEYMLKESYRVMKHGGIMILQTYPSRYSYYFMIFNKLSVIPILLFWLPKTFYSKFIELYHRGIIIAKRLRWKIIGVIPKGTHINCQTLGSISEFVSTSGFKIERAFAENTYSEYERTRFSKFMEKLLRNHTVTKKNIYIKAKKIL